MNGSDSARDAACAVVAGASAEAVLSRTRTPDEMRAARAEAKRLGISLAELLRRSLRTLLPSGFDQAMDALRRDGRVQ